MPTSPLPEQLRARTDALPGQGAEAADAKRNPEPEYKPPAQPLAADKRESPVLMALLLACWRWLTMPPAAGFGPPRPALRAPLAVLPATLRPAPRLAHLHAPPLRLLT
jgi:hypothetical protein